MLLRSNQMGHRHTRGCAGHWLKERIRFLERLSSPSEGRAASTHRAHARRQTLRGGLERRAMGDAPHKPNERKLPETVSQSAVSDLSEPQFGSTPSSPSLRIARASHGSRHSPRGSSLLPSYKPERERLRLAAGKLRQYWRGGASAISL